MSEWCKQCDAVLTWDCVVGTFSHLVWETLLVVTLWVSGPCWEVQGSQWGREEAPQRGQALQKRPLSFCSLYLFVQNLPQPCMCTFIFSPVQFLCILLLEEKFVQVGALQHCGRGSQVPVCLVPFALHPHLYSLILRGQRSFLLKLLMLDRGYRPLPTSR